MSFGYSVGDFVAVGQLAWKIYKACKDAPESFKNIAQEVLSLHVVLKELEETYLDANFSAAQQSRLRTVGDGCRTVLEDLQGLVNRYDSLGTSTKLTWDRVTWGSNDIAEIRSRLISNTGLLTTYINVSQVTVQKKLDMFLREFRDGKRPGSNISTQTVDSLSINGRQVWRDIRRELEDVGVSVAAFDANKDFIVNWLKTAIDTGAFEEETTEEDKSRSLFSEDDLSQSFENPGPDDTVLYQPLKNVGNDTNLTSSSAGLQALEISPRGRTQIRRYPPVVALANWLFGYNKNLLEATENEDEAKVRQALEKGANINTKNEKGLTPLFLAVSTGNVALSRLLLKKGADVNRKNGKGLTPLFLAVSIGHKALLELLLENGADIHIQDTSETRATVLSYSKAEAITSILLEHAVKIHVSDSDGKSSLRLAAESGRDTLVQLFLQEGAKIDEKDENGNTALHRAAIFGHRTIVQLLLYNEAFIHKKDRYGSTALHYAARYGHETVVQLLLESEADINEKNKTEDTALHRAAEFGHETVVQVLLNHGAKPNEINLYQWTAVHYAASIGHEKVMQLLLNHGATINKRDSRGGTALHGAAKHGHKTLVELLLNHGANIEEKNRSEYTALHLAAKHGHKTVVELLLKSGADVNAQSKYGYSPLRKAQDAKRQEVVKILAAAGGYYSLPYSRPYQNERLSSTYSASIIAERGNSYRESLESTPLPGSTPLSGSTSLSRSTSLSGSTSLPGSTPLTYLDQEERYF